MFRWRKLAAAAVVVGAGVALTGCTGSTAGSGSSSGTGGGTLTLGVPAAPTSFAAAEVQWSNAAPYSNAVYDTLLRADPKDASPEPWLATSWSYNTAKTVLTLKLRKGVKFTDGTALTADVAAQNLIRFRDGSGPDKSHLANMKDAKALDATTLQITLTAPDPAILAYLSQNAGLVESPKAFTSKTLATVPVGTGPYVLDTKATVVGSSYVFTKNPNYWAKKEQHWDKLVLKVLTTGPTVLNAIKGGQLDGANIIDPTILPQIKSSGFSFATQESDWVGLALFDRDGKLTPALKDVRVRQAINYAIDRPAVLKAAGKGNGTLTTQVFPTYSPGYDTALDAKYPYDPAKAKQLLAEAGYKSFTLNLPRIAGFGDTANPLIQQYLRAVGITVTFTNVATNNAITDLLGAKYSAAFFQLQEDPVAYQEAKFLLTPDAVFNPFKTNDPKVVSWVKTIQTGSEAESDTATKQLNAYVVDQAWNNVWYRNKNNFAYSSKLKVVPQAGNSVPYLYDITPKQ